MCRPVGLRACAASALAASGEPGGSGLPAADAADEAPDRYIKWLDELKEPARLKDYDDDLAGVARRLQGNNP